MEEEPWLVLSILKGPREGETFEFRPGSTVRIGRLVRGNTFAIKDAGISSKHLVIISESGGKWTVQDLDSSNGTTLNSSPLAPLQPSDLSGGDQIKLGGVTSMAVQFVFKIQNLEPIDASAAVAENVPKRRGRPPKPRVPAENTEARVTRSMKKEIECSEESGIQLEKKRPAETRRGKKNLPEIPVKNPDPVVVEIKEEAVSFVEEAREGDGNGGVVDSSADNIRPSEAMVGEGMEMSQKSNSDGQVPKTNGHGDSSKQRGEESEGEVEEMVDLEKMTARKWFDYMEVQLRKQTMEATEKIIDEMRNKADLVREYVAEQKRNKGIS